MKKVIDVLKSVFDDEILFKRFSESKSFDEMFEICKIKDDSLTREDFGVFFEEKLDMKTSELKHEMQNNKRTRFLAGVLASSLTFFSGFKPSVSAAPPKNEGYSSTDMALMGFGGLALGALTIGLINKFIVNAKKVSVDPELSCTSDFFRKTGENLKASKNLNFQDYEKFVSEMVKINYLLNSLDPETQLKFFKEIACKLESIYRTYILYVLDSSESTDFTRHLYEVHTSTDIRTSADAVKFSKLFGELNEYLGKVTAQNINSQIKKK